MFGGPGDDWIYDGDGHDGGIFGDDGNVFDLLDEVVPLAADREIAAEPGSGGPGQDNHWGEGGDDVFLIRRHTFPPPACMCGSRRPSCRGRGPDPGSARRSARCRSGTRGRS
jgi:hypothetical protein